MSEKHYEDLSRDILRQLKEQGITTLQLVLMDSGSPHQALVEVIPGKGESTGIHTISVNSADVQIYTDANSPMTKYVIDQDYLKRF